MSNSNLNYVRYDENNIAIVPQPLSNLVTTDPGDGWITMPFLNFNGNYVAYNSVNVPRTVLPFVQHGEWNQIIPLGTYVRMDENNNPVITQSPLQPASAALISSPDGLISGKSVYVLAGQYTGGIPPITYETQLQRERLIDSVWEAFTDWKSIEDGKFDLSNTEVGLRIRANTRISDRNTAPIIVTGIPVGPVQPS